MWKKVSEETPEICETFIGLPASRRVLVTNGKSVVIANLCSTAEGLEWVDSAGYEWRGVIGWMELPAAEVT